MAHSEQILNELMEISELVANLPAAHPYRVPEEYFDSLAENMIRHISIIEQDDNQFSFSATKISTPYKVPGDYFDAFAGTILSRIQADAANSDNEEEDSLSPLLVQLKTAMPYTLPEGYFNEFSSDVMAGVNAIEFVNQKLEAKVPVITEIKIDTPYQVPDGYFENLGETILGIVKNQNNAKVFSISFNKNVVRYSMAAIVAGMIAIAAWMFFQNGPSANSEQSMAAIEKISSDEMLSYLETTPDAPDDNSGTVQFSMKEEDVKEMLSDLPDEELQQYLDQQAVLKDMIIN